MTVSRRISLEREEKALPERIRALNDELSYTLPDDVRNEKRDELQTALDRQSEIRRALGASDA